MSGIAGIFYRDKRPVNLPELEIVGKALAQRGPDGITYYCQNSIGLIQCMLHDTPQSLLETLPHKSRSGLVITFHGRIDNRSELMEKTELKCHLSMTTDSDLVVAAYDKWGNTCAEHLLGDYAFAIWDENNEKLFCARDHMGVKPFYYYLSDKVFVFASEAKGCLAFNEVPKRLNEERISDFLTNVVIEKETTFYNEIFHLPPAHILEVYKNKNRLYRYYDLVPQKHLCKNSSDLEEQFREIFTDAVRCRIRSAFPVGAYLSGGLDSAAIVCTTAAVLKNELPAGIQTFSGIFDTVTSCDERQFFNSVLERYNIRHHFLHADLLHPGQAFDQLINIADEPPSSAHFFMKWNISCKAELAGMRIMLDGHDGDSAVSYGLGLFRELALQGNILGLIDEYKKFAPSSSNLRILRKIFRLYCNLIRERIPLFSFYSEEKRRINRTLRVLNHEFVSKTNIRERLSLYFENQPIEGLSEQEYHRRSILQPLQPYMLGFLERIGTHFSMIIQFPYFDKRIIEFCLALPCNEKFSQGYNRSIVRRSLKNYLPESISERKTKTDFSSNLINAFSVLDKEWLLKALDNISSTTYNYVNIRFVDECAREFFMTNKKFRQVSLYPLLRVISLNKWLEKF